MAPDTSIQAQLRDAQTQVPEYVGFASIEERKATDEAMRTKLNSMISDLFLHLVSLEAYLAQHEMDDLRNQSATLVQRYQDILDKVQSAPYGFSPFFTYDNLNESVQSNVLDKDLTLLQTLDRVLEILTITLRPDSDFQSVIESAEDLAVDLDNQVEDRINAIMEFS